nr:unnamed protein product [Spirometra erinaceieuropaei]
MVPPPPPPLPLQLPNRGPNPHAFAGFPVRHSPPPSYYLMSPLRLPSSPTHTHLHRPQPCPQIPALSTYSAPPP